MKLIDPAYQNKIIAFVSTADSNNLNGEGLTSGIGEQWKAGEWFLLLFPHVTIINRK